MVEASWSFGKTSAAVSKMRNLNPQKLYSGSGSAIASLSRLNSAPLFRERYKLRIMVLTHQPENILKIVADNVLGVDFAVRLISIQLKEVTLYMSFKNHMIQLLHHYFIYIFTAFSGYLTKKAKTIEIIFCRKLNFSIGRHSFKAYNPKSEENAGLVCCK